MTKLRQQFAPARMTAHLQGEWVLSLHAAGALVGEAWQASRGNAWLDALRQRLNWNGPVLQARNSRACSDLAQIGVVQNGRTGKAWFDSDRLGVNGHGTAGVVRMAEMMNGWAGLGVASQERKNDSKS